MQTNVQLLFSAHSWFNISTQ